MENMKAAALVVRRAKVIDLESPFHERWVDLALSASGEILAIKEDYQGSAEREWSAHNLHVSLGWMDPNAEFGGNQRDDRESLESLVAAAQAGGFTILGISPDSQPILDREAEIQQILAQGQKAAVDLRPYGAVSLGLAGKELSEMGALLAAGALGLSQANRVLSHAGLMKLALLYSRDLGQALRLHPAEIHLAPKGQMHEGPMSTALGLAGLPALAERIGLERDLAIAEYCESPVHFCALSSAEAVGLLAQAQNKIAHSGETCLLNLVLTDEALHEYDSRLKLYPPLRSERDRQALWQALRQGVLSGIASQHQARTQEEKECEFERAAFGAATLEIFFGALRAAAPPEVRLEELIDWISRRPRQVAGYRSEEVIAPGQKPSLSFFDPDCAWQWQDKLRKSRAANYPEIAEYLAGKTLRGKALATFSQGQLWLCPQL